MKIAFIVSEFPSVSQTFVLNQITGLIDRGNEVEIFAKKPGDNGKVHEDVKNYGLLDHTFYLKKTPSNRLSRIVKGIKIIFMGFLIKPSVIFRSLNFFKFGRRAINFDLFFLIFPFLKRGPYDIIHCHFGPNGLIGSRLKSIGIFKGKLITSFHAYDLTSYIGKKDKEIYKRLFEVGDLFQPVSVYWKKELMNLGCKEKKICVHRMGVDIEKFSFLTSRYSNFQEIRLISVARLVEKKGIEYGIIAFSKILAKYPNIEYFIIGDGPLKNHLLDLIVKLNIKNNIRIFGWMNQCEITEMMDKCTILLAPSITDKNGEKEGIPVVLMEAMAKGLPVISTYHSGIPELVINEKTGFLVDEKDISELANKIEYLISNPQIIKEFGIEGRKVIEENYNIQKLNDTLIKTYRELV
jgi:colanic acid/amylovoran biosynthesis glycosyltransferase